MRNDSEIFPSITFEKYPNFFGNFSKKSLPIYNPNISNFFMLHSEIYPPTFSENIPTTCRKYIQLCVRKILKFSGYKQAIFYSKNFRNFFYSVLVDNPMATKKPRRRRESAALGRRMPWANRLFSKSMKTKILNFLHEVEKTISVISIQD